MWNIKAPGAYPLGDFQKICRVCTPFRVVIAVEIGVGLCPRFLLFFFGWISLDFLKGLWSYGGFNLTGLVTDKFSGPPSGETMRWTPKVLEVQERARGPLSSCRV